jgi:DMSO/TMAO reductase YedYZ molybdopterin-dependent catalytic subunit
MCISNHVSAGLISNAEWRGVPMADLLFAAGVKPGAVEVVLRGADGYTDTFSIDKALEPTTLVVYEINGEPLSRIHGSPVRIIVPGLFGEKNVKWVTGIEVVTSDVKGFYEQQGWGPSFEIPTRSDFFSPAMNSGNRSFREPFALNQSATLRGRAFAGDRDISKVEITLDDGETWQEVTTFDYQGTSLTWKFWSYRWTPRQAGEFVLAVRAYDGAGELQPVEPLPSDPREGTTGLHRVRATVE